MDYWKIFWCFDQNSYRDIFHQEVGSWGNSVIQNNSRKVFNITFHKSTLLKCNLHAINCMHFEYPAWWFCQTHTHIHTHTHVYHYHSQFQKFLLPPQCPLEPGAVSLSFLPTPRLPLTYFLSLYVSLHFLEFHINAVIQYLLFCVWLLSFSTMPLSFIHVAVHQ